MSPNSPSTSPPRLAGWVVRAIAHSLGVLVSAVAVFALMVDWATFEVMWASAQHADFLAMSTFEIAVHLGLAGCMWALAVLGFEVVTSRRAPVKKLLDAADGSVMTETLVVLPIFLLLTFGIAQLAVNNMAGLVTNTAVFQSGRTVWLWTSEAEANRRGVTMDKVRELARVQAAAVLTPVAPGEFIQSLGGGSDEFLQMRGALLGSQIPTFSQDAGNFAMTAANGFMAGENLTHLPGPDSAFFRAFDESGFRQRTVRKFTFAYHATEVEIIDESDRVGVRLTYNHHQAFPMVGALFGDVRTDIGSRPGYYSEIEREFTMPPQILPNPRWE
ncbi:MAG: hypothetical protein ACLFVJ_12025 [Persicimonas sp.]